jgi:predicted Zn-dependent protease
LILMARACFDPRGSLEVWANMARAAGGGPPEFASTHPSHGTRIEALTGAMEEAMAARNEEQCPALEGA